MQTVRDYLEHNKNITGVHMMTPDGFIDLTKEKIDEVLSGCNNIQTHFGCRGYGIGVNPEEILKQYIRTDIQLNDDGSTSFLTDYTMED